ncbi:MAG: DUF4124 domain-containing protein [Deltaproteobacteria bacterium]|nr:DUF4124 domain-containing protein [Deltaproteobacteria bacterium]
MKICLVLLVAVLGASISAYADTYQWVDDKGVVNFTDNPESIPKKYLKKVKVSPSAAADQGSRAPTPAYSESAPPTDQATRNQLYGGHDESWWRSRYASLRGEIKSLQDNLPAKREELEELRRQQTIYTYPRNRIAYQNKLAEIQQDEAKISELTAQLANLDVEAAAAAVPFDWRR